MSRNAVNKAQNRGRRRRLTTKNIDNLNNGIDVLKGELGIGNEPEPVYDEPKMSGVLQFGLTEALGGFFLIAAAAIVNWHFG